MVVVCCILIDNSKGYGIIEPPITLFSWCVALFIRLFILGYGIIVFAYRKVFFMGEFFLDVNSGLRFSASVSRGFLCKM